MFCFQLQWLTMLATTAEMKKCVPRPPSGHATVFDRSKDHIRHIFKKLFDHEIAPDEKEVRRTARKYKFRYPFGTGPNHLQKHTESIINREKEKKEAQLLWLERAWG